jgi:hypothetical protein
MLRVATLNVMPPGKATSSWSLASAADHTTVQAVRKIEALRTRDGNLAGDLDAIARALAALA